MSDIPSDLYFPPGATAPIGGLAQTAIWSSSAYRDLFPYVVRLLHRFQLEPCSRDIKSWSGASTAYLAAKFYHSLKERQLQHWQSDVLIVGECRSQYLSEIRIMTRLVAGILRRGLSVLYLVRFNSQEYQELVTFVHKHNWQEQIQFLDPWETAGPLDKIFRLADSNYRAYRDWCTLQDILPSDIYLPPDSYNTMLSVALTKGAWELLESHLSFSIAIVLNHFQPLSSLVASACIARKLEVVTFQHGVISHPVGYFPVTATRAVCFGSCSRNLLMALDKKLAQAAKKPQFCKDFILAGSLFDELRLHPSQQEYSSLLVVDQGNLREESFYGMKPAKVALSRVIREVIERAKVLKRVIIRPHPRAQAKDLSNWLTLAEEYPDKIVFSHPALRFEFELSRTSIAIGLFSGGLITAAACGIPTIFLWEPGWFYTPDLACFTDHLFVSPSDAIGRIETLLTNVNDYSEAREAALNSSQYYYFNRQLCTFNDDLVEQLLDS